MSWPQLWGKINTPSSTPSSRRASRRMASAPAQHQRIEHPRMSARQEGERLRQRQHRVVVFQRQQIGLDLLGPEPPLIRAALGAMSVFAAMKKCHFLPAPLAHPVVRTEHFRAADQQLAQHPILLHGQLRRLPAAGTPGQSGESPRPVPASDAVEPRHTRRTPDPRRRGRQAPRRRRRVTHGPATIRRSGWQPHAESLRRAASAAATGPARRTRRRPTGPGIARSRSRSVCCRRCCCCWRGVVVAIIIRDGAYAQAREEREPNSAAWPLRSARFTKLAGCWQRPPGDSRRQGLTAEARCRIPGARDGPLRRPRGPPRCPGNA